MPFATLRRYGKQVVGHTETIPVVSVADYFSGYLNNPGKRVGGSLDCLITLLMILLGQGLCYQFIPDPHMDNEI